MYVAERGKRNARTYMETEERERERERESFNNINNVIITALLLINYLFLVTSDILFIDKRERKIDRHTDRQRHRQTDRHRQRDTDRQRHRQTDRQTDRRTGRDTEREREINSE